MQYSRRIFLIDVLGEENKKVNPRHAISPFDMPEGNPNSSTSA